VAVNHAYYYSDSACNRRWPERVKLQLTKSASENIAVSASVAQRMPTKCTVIPNPVDLSIYQARDGNNARSKDIVFLGRLVSDKGCDLLIEALDRLGRDVRPSLTVIGDGPERLRLQQMVKDRNFSQQVTFVGAPSSEQVSSLLHQHKIMVVPSRYEESFGVVALEGAAAGCFIIGSDGGGLAEAIGPAGITFRRNDAVDLANKLADVCANFPALDQNAIETHLALHRPDRIAELYLNVMKAAAKDE